MSRIGEASKQSTEGDFITSVNVGDIISLVATEGGGFLQADPITGCFVERPRRSDPDGTCYGFQNCLFEIVPKFQYSALKACEKRLRHAGIRDVSLGNRRAGSDLRYSEKADIARYIKPVLDEQEINRQEHQKLRGSPVRVGSVVQLLHTASGRFLTQLRDRAINDRLAMEVGLDFGRKDSWWIVKDAEEMKAMGHPLLYGEKIIFESVKFDGSFVCLEIEDAAGISRTSSLAQTPAAGISRTSSLAQTSRPPWGDNFVAAAQSAILKRTTVLHQSVLKRVEITGSSYPCAFQLNAFRSFNDVQKVLGVDEKEPGGSHVCGLSVVRLWRRQEERLLAALPAHHRAAWLSQSSLHSNPGRASELGQERVCIRSMWRIVPSSAHGAGRGLPLHEPSEVLLQSMSCGLYLTLTRGGMVALTPQHAEEGCRWRVHPLRDGAATKSIMLDGEIVLLDSAVCGAGKQWMAKAKTKHAESGEYQAELTKPDASAKSHAVRIQLVSGEVASIVDQVNTCKAVLEGLRAGLQGSGDIEELQEYSEEQERIVAIVTATSGRVIQALDSLCNLCAPSLFANTAQQAIGELEVLPLVMSILDLLLGQGPEDEEAPAGPAGAETPWQASAALPPPAPPVQDLCKRLYTVIETSCLNNSANGRVLVEYANSISQHLGAEVGAYSALLQIYGSSRDLLGSLPDSFFSSLTSILDRHRSCKTVNIIIQSCSCNGVPVRSNQDRWARLLFQEHQDLFFVSEVVENDITLTMKGEEGFSVSVRELVKGGEDWIAPRLEGQETLRDSQSNSKAWVLPYHLAMLRVIQAVIAGRNQSARQVVLEHAKDLRLYQAQLRQMIELPEASFVLRAECCRLMNALYIDVEPHRTLPGIMRVCTWSTVNLHRDGQPDYDSQASPAAVGFTPTGDALLQADVEQEKWKHLEVGAIKAMVSKEIEKLHLSGDAGKASSVFREHYFGGLVQLVTELLRFGFYHKAPDTDPQGGFWPSVDVNELKWIAVALFGAMGGSLKPLQRIGSGSAQQSALGERQADMVFSNANAVLSLMMQLLECGMQCQISAVFRFWESTVATRVLQMEEEAFRGLAADDADSEAENPLLGTEGADSNARHSGREALRQLVRVGLEENPLLPLLRVEDLRFMSPKNPPKMLRVLLSLITLRSETTQQSALRFMIAVFYQRHQLCATLSSVQIVVGSELSRKLADLHAHTLALRRHLQQLSITRPNEEQASMEQDSLKTCKRILDNWVQECKGVEARTTWDELHELQSLFCNFNVPVILESILRLSVEPRQADARTTGRLLETSADSELRGLIVCCETKASAYRVLAFLCLRWPKQQQSLIKHLEDKFWQHAEIEGLNPECVMLAIARDSSSALKGWIERIFAMIVRFQLVRPTWLHLLRLLMVEESGQAHKDRQTLVANKLNEIEVHVIKVVQTKEEWDERVAQLACGPGGPEAEALEWHIQSVELLAALGTNRSAACQIFAASHLSCRQALDTIASADIDCGGFRPALAVDDLMKFRLRSAHIRFLSAVYLKTEVRRLYEELEDDKGGFWSLLWTGPHGPPCTGMSLFVQHVQDCWQHAELEAQSLQLSFERTRSTPFLLAGELKYVFDALLPMLCTYFEAHEELPRSVEEHRDTAVALMDVVKRVSWSVLGRKCPSFHDFKLGKWIGTQQRLVSALASRLGLQVDAVWMSRMSVTAREKDKSAHGMVDDEQRRLVTLKTSFTRLIGSIKAELLIGTEMVKLPLVLGSDVDIEPIEAGDGDTPQPEEPTVDYAQALKELVSIAKDNSVGDDLLLDLLHIVRLAIHSVEPSGPDLLPDAEITAAFQRFSRGAAVQKLHGAGALTVAWMQNKYDMLGVTWMAMRLIGHANEEVQSEALRLLLTMLQGGNSRTQQSALAFLATASRQQKWFETCSNVLHAAVKHLHKASKRKKEGKTVKERAAQPGPTAQQRVSSASGLAAFIEDGNDATSRAMAVLRMLELLCQNQCVEWQDVMTQQRASATSYDLLRSCADLLETLQPMLQSTQSTTNTDIFILAVQTVNTISSMIQGPHKTNQKALLSTEFVSTINRLLAGVVYVSEAPPAPEVPPSPFPKWWGHADSERKLQQHPVRRMSVHHIRRLVNLNFKFHRRGSEGMGFSARSLEHDHGATSASGLTAQASPHRAARPLPRSTSPPPPGHTANMGSMRFTAPAISGKPPLLDQAGRSHLGEAPLAQLEQASGHDEIASSGLQFVLDAILQDRDAPAAAEGRLPSESDLPEPTPPEQKPGEAAAMNDLRCWFRTAAIRCMCSIFEETKDSKVLARLAESLKVNPIVNQICSSGDLLLLTTKADNQNTQRADARRAFSMKWRDRPTWLFNIEHRLGFSPGFEKSVEEEMIWSYILLLHLLDCDDGHGEAQKAMKDLKHAHPRLTNYLREHMSHVELARSVDGIIRVERMYFPLDGAVVQLSKSRDLKAEMDLRIRSLPQIISTQKYRDLLKMLKDTVNRLLWLKHLNRSRTFRFALDNRAWLDYSPLAVSALITVLMALFYGIPIDPNTGHVLADGRFFAKDDASIPAGYKAEDYPFADMTSDPFGSGSEYGTVVNEMDLSLKFRISLSTRWESGPEWEFWPGLRALLWCLGVLHALLTLLVAAIYLVVDFPITWAQSNLEATAELRKTFADEGQAPAEAGAWSLAGGVPLRNQISGKLHALGALHAPRPPVDPALHVSATQVLWRALRRSPMLLNYAFFLCVSVLGCISSPLLFALCNMDYFRMPGGQMVLGALRVGSPALLRSLVIASILVAFFGFYVYAYFSQSAIIASDTCHSLFQCTITHFLDSIKFDLATVIGVNPFSWAFPAMVPWADSWLAWRSFIVVIFTVIWAFLLQPVIVGQIVDAFVVLRRQKEDAWAEMEEKCFISGLHRFKFDSIPGEWEGRRCGKYTWNYLFFLFWLTAQDPDDLTSAQRQVLKQIARDNADFFPSGISVAIDKDEREDKTNAMVHEVAILKQQQHQILAAIGVLEQTIRQQQPAGEDANTIEELPVP